MAKLHDIVRSVLTDLIDAQHAANCYSASLAKQYARHGTAHGFPLPSVRLGALDFALPYAVAAETSQQVSVLQWQEIRAFFHELAERAPLPLIRTCVNTISASKLPSPASQKRFDALTHRKAVWKDRFCGFLQHRFARELEKYGGSLVTREAGFDRALAAELLFGVIETHLLRNPDISSIIGEGAASDGIRSACRADIVNEALSLMEELETHYAFVAETTATTLEIDIEAGKLKTRDAHSISCLHFHLEPARHDAMRDEQQNQLTEEQA